MYSQVVSHAWPPPNTPIVAFSSITVRFLGTPTGSSNATMTVETTIDFGFPASYLVPDTDTIRNMLVAALRVGECTEFVVWNVERLLVI
jgi:hypothetical protein